MSKTGKKSLFEELYNASPEEKKKINYPFALQKAKLKFQNAAVNAQIALSNAETKLREARASFDDVDLTKVVNARVEVRSSQGTLEFLKEEYEELFGESLNLV
jgi:hypothetical protein